MHKACNYLSDYAHNIIKERKNNKEALKNNKDILNMFINAEVFDDENGNIRRLSDKELSEIILNLIIAGMY